MSLSAAWIARTPALLAFGGLQPRSAVRLWFGSLTIVFHRTSVNLRWLPPSFRFPETKSAHLKFSPLSDPNLLGGSYVCTQRLFSAEIEHAF